MHQLRPRPGRRRHAMSQLTARQRAGGNRRRSHTHTAARQRQLESRRDRPGARQPKAAGKGEPHACWHHGRARQQRQDGARHEAISSSFDEQFPPTRHASFYLCSLPRSLPPRASSACRVSCLSLTHARPARWLLARRLARAGCFRLADPLLLRVPSEGLTELTHGIKRLKERSPVE
jgi:hypothetical protein